MQKSDSAIQKFSLNPHGRDFIVGDIHGCFDQLNQALYERNFNPAADRLFAVGDLIDRGPGSHKVLSWLDQPWFHSCRGNHEEMAITLAPESKEGDNWFRNYGGEWWLELDEAARQSLRDAFTKLPYAIELESRHGPVGLVHADIPKGMSWGSFVKLLNLGDLDTRRTALWGRSRIKSLFSPTVKEIARVVCGHSVTPTRRIYTKANVWFLETGAYLGDHEAHLSLITTDDLFV